MNQKEWEKYKDNQLKQDAIYNIKIAKALKFLEHIEEHIANGDTGSKDHKVMCKVCNKNIDEITK